MAQMNTELIPVLNESMEIDLPASISYEQLKEKLRHHVNHLIQSDFQKLVAILYRIDVNEEKLKYLLQENTGKDASLIITELIIERQLQKIKSRQQYNRRDENTEDAESW